MLSGTRSSLISSSWIKSAKWLLLFCFSLHTVEMLMCSFKRTLYLNYTIFQGEILSFLHHYMILKALVFTSDFTPFTQTVYKNYKGINYLWDAGQVIGSSPTLNTQYTYGTWTQCHIEITSSVRQGTWVIKWVRIRQRGTVDFLSIDTDQTSKASHSRRVRADNIVGINFELCRMSASEKKEMCREQEGGQWQSCSCHFWKYLLLRSVFQTLTERWSSAARLEMDGKVFTRQCP